MLTNKLNMLRTVKFAQNLLHREFSQKKYVILKEEYTVSPFVKLSIDCSFPIALQPLDVHEYQNSDKILLEVTGKSESTKATIECSNDNDKFTMIGKSEKYNAVAALLQVPIKSDIKINSKSDVTIGKFNGDNIIVENNKGNITTESLLCEHVILRTNSGNICCKGPVQAALIEIETKNGNVTTNRLQGKALQIITKAGNIEIGSCYCQLSRIDSQTGSLKLNNIHKTCMVTGNNLKDFTMTGFDGVLMANIKKSRNIDVHLAQVTSNSEINVTETSPILLKLSETVQECCNINLTSDSLKVEETIEMNFSKTPLQSPEITNLTPYKTQSFVTLKVNGEKCPIRIKPFTWSQMFKLRGFEHYDE